MKTETAELPHVAWDPTDIDRPDVIRMSLNVWAWREENMLIVKIPMTRCAIDAIKDSSGHYDPGYRGWCFPVWQINDVLSVMKDVHEELVSAGIDRQNGYRLEMRADWSLRPSQILPEHAVPGLGDTLDGRFENRIVEKIGEPFDPEDDYLALHPELKGVKLVRVWHRAMTQEELDLRQQDHLPQPI